MRQVEKLGFADIGDWLDGSATSARCTDPRSTAAILVHELVEKLVCDYYGITYREVDRDDASGMPYNRRCYWRAHLAALRAERTITKALGLSWKEHERNCEAAFRKQVAALIDSPGKPRRS